MTTTESKVLAAYAVLTREDERGAWNPYYPDIAVAVGGDPSLAYSACKALKATGLLECNGRQGAHLMNAPAYWATDAGLALL
jgi:hypothetical protein